MKVLLVADVENAYIWDHFDRKVFADVELVISCGDLHRSYLDFLVTMLPVPLLFVPGNHDTDFIKDPPAGCIDLSRKMFVYKGLRFLGFGGALSPQNRPCHYSEAQMRWMVYKRRPEMLLHRGFDVLVTHAPARGLGDGQDAFHKGFEVYREMIQRYMPLYFIHGHQHLNYSIRNTRTMALGDTTIVNAYSYYILDMQVPQKTPQGIWTAK